jgi:endonuclease/exonuclease/phosphatase (EEP) superfamily protein YafD
MDAVWFRNAVLRFLMVVAFLFVSGPVGWAGPLDSFQFDERPIEGAQQIDELVRQKRGFKVLWWNIANCVIAPRALANNLDRLLHSEIAPDFIALGEYDLDLCGELLDPLLREFYPYWHFENYNENLTRTGILVVSKRSFTRSVRRNLDWTPSDLPRQGREEYRRREVLADSNHGRDNVRPLVIYHVGEGDGIDLIPLHLDNPWAAMREAEGRTATGAEMLVGSDTPLAHQIVRLHRVLDHILNPESGHFLVFGDMNTPEAVLGVQPQLFHILRGRWKDVFLPASGAFFESSHGSFPAQSSGFRSSGVLSVWQPQIDHAFTSEEFLFQIRGREIIPLQGSDHYPLFVVIDLWSER